MKVWHILLIIILWIVTTIGFTLIWNNGVEFRSNYSNFSMYEYTNAETGVTVYVVTKVFENEEEAIEFMELSNATED